MKNTSRTAARTERRRHRSDESVKSSFDANVLETLCEVCWGVEQSSVTDDFLLEKIHEITDSFQNQELPDVKELFREELRMNMSTTDIDARVIEYFHLCNSLIKTCVHEFL